MRKVNYWLSLIMVWSMPWMDMLHIGGLGTLSRVLGLAVAALWLWLVLLAGRTRKPALFHLVALLFVLWVAATVWWSWDVERSWARLFIYVRMLGLALVIWDLYESPTMIKSALQAYVLGAYVHAGGVIYNYWVGAESVYGRFAGVGNIANTTAYVLGMAMPLAWYLATMPEATWSRQRLLQVLNLAYFPVALLAIALTATRFGIIMAVPATLYGLAMLLRAHGKRALFIVPLLIVVLWGFSTFVPVSSIARLAAIDESIVNSGLTGRFELWKTAWTTWEEHTLRGIGIDAFPTINPTGQVVHNTNLVVLVETGVIGLALYGLMLIIVWVTAWRLPFWESFFWLVLLIVWGTASLVLNLAEDKSIWLFFSLLITNARIVQSRQQTAIRGLATGSNSVRPLPNTRALPLINT